MGLYGLPGQSAISRATFYKLARNVLIQSLPLVYWSHILYINMKGRNHMLIHRTIRTISLRFLTKWKRNSLDYRMPHKCISSCLSMYHVNKISCLTLSALACFTVIPLFNMTCWNGRYIGLFRPRPPKFQDDLEICDTSIGILYVISYTQGYIGMPVYKG